MSKQFNETFECMVCGKSDPSGGCGRSDCPYGEMQNDFEDEALGEPQATYTNVEACSIGGCESCQ